jgi:hypothetical protein
MNSCFGSQRALNTSPDLSQYQWFTPVILTTQEAEIRKIMVRRQLGQLSLQNYLKKTHHKKGASAGGVAQGVGPEFKPQYHKKKSIDVYQMLCEDGYVPKIALYVIYILFCSSSVP